MLRMPGLPPPRLRGRSAPPKLLRLGQEPLPAARGRHGDDLQVVAAGDHVERLHADRPGRAEDHNPFMDVEAGLRASRLAAHDSSRGIPEPIQKWDERILHGLPGTRRFIARAGGGSDMALQDAAAQRA